jgi:cytochrome c
MNRLSSMAAIAIVLGLWSSAYAEEGNAALGRRIFGACAACHALQPGKNMTGPSLAHLWNRKSGSLPDFARYSPALKSAGIVWNDKTLDAWIADPQHLVPGTTMTFPGIKNAKQRADLLAFLQQATQSNSAQSAEPGRGGGGMAGMMGGGGVPNLKHLTPDRRVQTITYCSDTYRVTTADGKTHAFWERNLRLKTDSSKDGPQKNAPALIPAGMMGDRADVIFADPGEISPRIAEKC